MKQIRKASKNTPKYLLLKGKNREEKEKLHNTYEYTAHMKREQSALYRQTHTHTTHTSTDDVTISSPSLSLSLYTSLQSTH